MNADKHGFLLRLASTMEVKLMHIDAHQHFWRYNAEAYGWIGEDMAVLKRDYLPPDLRPLQQTLSLKGDRQIPDGAADIVAIEGTVAVQARQTLEETRWLLDLADAQPFIKGVVGWVDLHSPRLREQLTELSRHPKLVGVRHVVHDEEDDCFMLREDFVRGIGMLAEFDLPYDLLLFPQHLPVASTLVAQFPNQRFVLDHIGKPPIREGTLEPWATDIRKLAAFPNVFCKVSGMVTEANWECWTPEDFTPYLDVVFEAFGAERLMIGSDWPVCTVAGHYAEVMQIVIDYLDQRTEAEREAVLGQTAAAFYHLDV
jgi:L-fuconolactonase